MFHKLRNVLLLLLIVFIGWFFRFNNVNWDNNYHLHPDERFLTMVSTAMKLPTSLNEYLDQKTSLLNPGNIGYKFFVYGSFPLVINKYLAVLIKADNYNQLTILGRQLSAFFDLLIVIFVFKTVKLLTNFGHFEHSEKSSPDVKPGRNASLDFSVVKGLLRNDSIPYLASFIYAISVLPIQLSHFFAVDSFLNFFMFGSFFFILRFWSSQNDVILVSDRRERIQNLLLSAIFFGLALACKVTALFILPLILIIQTGTGLKRPGLLRPVLFIILFSLIAYLTLRLANPYYFQNQSFFDPTLNKDFISNLQSLKSMTVKDINNWYPPMVQWLSKNTILHSLVNNIVFGFGIVSVIFLIAGILRVLLSFPRRRESIPIFIILIWVFGFFVYQSLQTTPTLRYFIFLYPFFAIFAGMGVHTVISSVARNPATEGSVKNKKLFVICNLVFVILFLIWPMMFSSIYFHKNTRVEASEWIYKNLPNNSYILSEYWDDALPMPVANNYGKTFTGTQLKVFDQDTTEKWQVMNQELAKADYYILSSNRGWGSIMDTPIKYPLMSKFYKELFIDKTGYRKIKEFTSYPKFSIFNFQFSINDDWSDEGFTVYDHPKVLIYKNVKK